MKTKFATLLLCMFFMLHGKAQSDGFFNYQSTERAINETPVPFYPKEEQGFQNMNVNATPLGNGFVILSTISILYVFSRRKEESK